MQANLATEATTNPYILVNLERKGNVETSRKTTPGVCPPLNRGWACVSIFWLYYDVCSYGDEAGGAQVKRDARTGNFDVQWHEGFVFSSLQPDQKLSFTWFDFQDASSTG